MKKPAIAITGANGFIGSALVKHFLQQGYPVIALSRNNSPFKNAISRKYDFNTEPTAALLDSAEVLIHCAFEKNDPKIHGINYKSGKMLFEAAASAGIKKIIFFSSVAAQTYIRSDYGQSKLAIESLLDDREHIILKSSLVIGNGGLFHRLLHTALSKKYVPLIQGGTQPLQCISLTDLLQAVTTMIEQELKGTFVLANTQHLSYREFFDIISSIHKKRLRYISIPAWALLALVRLGAMIKLRLPVSRENIHGLISQKWVDPSASLSSLKLVPKSLEEALTGLNDDPALP